MNEFISKYIDLMALGLTFLVPFIMTLQLKKRAGKSLRAVPLYLFVFGPSGILAFIFFHLFENVYRAVLAIAAGNFKYDFRFYSLILLGVVVAYLGILFLKACRRKSLSDTADRDYWLLLFLILLFTLPLIPIIPIAAVPLICCAISVLGFPFVRRKVKYKPLPVEENSFRLTAPVVQ